MAAEIGALTEEAEIAGKKSGKNPREGIFSFTAISGFARTILTDALHTILLKYKNLENQIRGNENAEVI